MVESANKKFKAYRKSGGEKQFTAWLSDMQTEGKLENHNEKSFSADGEVEPVKKDYKKYIGPAIVLSILVIGIYMMNRASKNA